MATGSLNNDGVCCLGNRGAWRAERNLNTHPAPIKLKVSTNKLPISKNQQRFRRRSDGVPRACGYLRPLDPPNISSPIAASLLRALSFHQLYPLRAASSSPRPQPVPGAVRPLIPVTRLPKVIWPTFLSAALWDIWALRPVFWRAICAPSSYPCWLLRGQPLSTLFLFCLGVFCLFFPVAFNGIKRTGGQMQLNVGGEEKGEKVKESPGRTCDEIGLESALEEKRRWPLFSPSTADIESIWATRPPRSVLPPHAPSTCLHQMLLGGGGVDVEGTILERLGSECHK